MKETQTSITVEPGLRPELAYRDGEPVKAKSKKPVLIQNKANSYKFVSEENAKQMIKDHEAVEVLPSDPDFLDGTKKALGFWENKKPHETIQMGGKFVTVEEIGKLNIDDMIKAAEKAVKDYGEGKLIIPVNKMPAALETFAGKKHNRRFE